jgi:hypothetical protein
MTVVDPEPPGEITVTELQTVTQKLIEVAGAIGFIEKKGYNQAQSYAFVRGDDVIADVRVQMLQRRVLLLAGLKEITERSRATRGGGETTISTLKLEFIFHDADTGEQLALPWAGQGEDPGDKGLGKAFTNALKTFLRQQLMIPWGHEDPEADTGSDQRVGSDDSVNLIDEARGLNNATLNAVLVKVGLSAQQAPFGFFMRIPAEKAVAVKAALLEERS